MAKESVWGSAPAELPKTRLEEEMPRRALFQGEGLWDLYGTTVQGAHLRRAVLAEKEEQQTQSEGLPMPMTAQRGRGRGKIRGRQKVASKNVATGRGVGGGPPQGLVELMDSTPTGDPENAIRGATRPNAYSPRETRAKKKERMQVENHRQEMYQILTDIARERFLCDTQSEYYGHANEVPLESQHGPNAISGHGPIQDIRTNLVGSGSMDTIDLVLAGDTVSYSQPGTKVEMTISHRPFVSTTPHESWTAARAGLHVLTTGEKLGHIGGHGLPHEIVEGTIIAEWVEGVSGTPMLLAKFPGEEGPTQLRTSDCRLENVGMPIQREVGESSRRHKGKLAHRGLHFPIDDMNIAAVEIEKVQVHLGSNREGTRAEFEETIWQTQQSTGHPIRKGSIGSQEPRPPVPTVVNEARVPLPPLTTDTTRGKKTLPSKQHGRVIPEYAQEEEGSTQESTAAKKIPFPQVEVAFPPYLDDIVGSGASGDNWSSGSEWLGSLGGESTDSDKDDFEDWENDIAANRDRFFPTDGNDLSFEEWADTPESYRNVELTIPQFDAFYQESNWGSEHVTLLGSRDTFCGPQPGATTIVTSSLPTPENLFKLYWTDAVIDRIVQETNRYAMQIVPSKHRSQVGSNQGAPPLPANVESRTKGGKTWKALDAVEFRAWLGIIIYMGIVKLPNRRLYWTQKHDLLQCSYIPRVMSCKRWESIRRCLHLVDNSLLTRILRPNDTSSSASMERPSNAYTGRDPCNGTTRHKGKESFLSEEEFCSSGDSSLGTDDREEESADEGDWGFPINTTQDQDNPDLKTLPTVDKLAKCRWIIDWFNVRSQQIYNAEPFITIDELIIPYKGQYCTIRQFLPAKPVRFGIKLWGLASSKSRFVSLVSVYMGKGTGQGEFGLGHQVVMDLVSGLAKRWHTVVTDNFFSSTRLAHELMRKGFWFCGTIKTNSKGLPRALKRAKSQTQKGSIVIKMHRGRQIVGLSWQDKEMVTFLSTGADAWQPGIQVERRQRGRVGKATIPSTPVHLMYQEHMRGVDVTDQLRTNYSCLLSTHKWWHKIFCYVVDQSIINSYILHCEESQRLGLPLLNHMYFNLAVGDYLVAPFLRPISVASLPPHRAHRPQHGPEKSSLRRYCVACGSKQRGFCAGCEYRWMCPLNCYNFCHLPENLGKMPRKGKRGRRLY